MPPPLYRDDQLSLRLIGQGLLRVDSCGEIDVLAAESERAGPQFLWLEVPCGRLVDVVADTKRATSDDAREAWLLLRGCFQRVHESGSQSGRELAIGPLTRRSAVAAAERLRAMLALPRSFEPGVIAELRKTVGEYWIRTVGTYQPTHFESPDFELVALTLPQEDGVAHELFTTRTRLRVEGLLSIPPERSPIRAGVATVACMHIAGPS